MSRVLEGIVAGVLAVGAIALVVATFVAVCAIPSTLFAWAAWYAFGWPFFKTLLVAFTGSLLLGGVLRVRASTSD